MGDVAAWLAVDIEEPGAGFRAQERTPKETEPASALVSMTLVLGLNKVVLQTITSQRKALVQSGLSNAYVMKIELWPRRGREKRADSQRGVFVRLPLSDASDHPQNCTREARERWEINYHQDV